MFPRLPSELTYNELTEFFSSQRVNIITCPVHATAIIFLSDLYRVDTSLSNTFDVAGYSAVIGYRISSNKRRGANSRAALIRGWHLFQHCTKQISFSIFLFNGTLSICSFSYELLLH